MTIGVRVGVCVGGRGVGDLYGCGVTVGGKAIMVAVNSGEGVANGVIVFVRVLVGIGVPGVRVEVGVRVGMGVQVAVAVRVGRGVRVGPAVSPGKGPVSGVSFCCWSGGIVPSGGGVGSFWRCVSLLFRSQAESTASKKAASSTKPAMQRLPT